MNTPSMCPVENRPSARALVAGLPVALLFLLASTPLIWTGYDAGRGAWDQNLFHLPAIRSFARQLPRPDVTDYPSATTPAFHLMLATVDRWISDDVRVLRSVGSLFTAALLTLLGAAVAASTGAARAFVLALPMACSLYVFSSGVWLLPDNAAWLGVLGAVLLAMRQPLEFSKLVAAGAVLLLLVLTRQIHLWAASLFWAAAWLAPANRRRWLAVSALAVMPAFAAVAGFIFLWDGAVPPCMREAHQKLSPAVPAVVLSLVGVFGLAFTGFLLPCLRQIRCNFYGVMIGMAIGLLLGILPETSYSFEAGRSSGIWNIVRRLPVILDRSPLLIVLATLGGGMAAAWIAALGRHRGSILLVAWVAFSMAHTAGGHAWQRYFEPFVLMTLILSAGWTGAPTASRRAFLGPAVLAVALAAVTFVSLA